jgi:hypothetical protein
MTKARTSRFVSPVFIALQLTPPSVLLKIPPEVPAYTVEGVVGSIARALIFRFVSPVFTALQLPPPSVLLNTPPPKVPAYKVEGVVGSTARVFIFPPFGPPIVHILNPAKALFIQPIGNKTNRILRKSAWMRKDWDKVFILDLQG